MPFFLSPIYVPHSLDPYIFMALNRTDRLQIGPIKTPNAEYIIAHHIPFTRCLVVLNCLLIKLIFTDLGLVLESSASAVILSLD